jgi:plasmid maintenance system antidote protein VapI
MSTNTSKPAPITDPLRRAIVESGITYKALWRETGVTRASIQRFVEGRNSLRLDIADRLAAYFGLSLRAQTRKRR